MNVTRRLLRFALLALLFGARLAAAENTSVEDSIWSSQHREHSFVIREGSDKAHASGFDVMRVWGSLVIGNSDGTNSVDPNNTSVYFQFWNDSADALAFNEYVQWAKGNFTTNSLLVQPSRIGTSTGFCIC